jgi:peptide/nickel transport system ATP-binding protein
VVRFISDEVLVMQQGDVVEQAHAETLLAHPQQDYTKRLLGAVPRGYQAA